MNAKSHTKVLPAVMALSAALLLGGCSGVLVGNLVVLAITLGIFFGTLGLGRASSPATRSADRSQTQQPRA
ncbi:MAG: hypothetical protein M3Y87_26875 [Myxococcota bacterium]|nr:hypothetical protein [Myxococcota bacterium]